MLCGNLHGKEIQVRGSVCIHMADSLCCTRESNTTSVKLIYSNESCFRKTEHPLTIMMTSFWGTKVKTWHNQVIGRCLAYPPETICLKRTDSSTFRGCFTHWRSMVVNQKVWALDQANLDINSSSTNHVSLSQLSSSPVLKDCYEEATKSKHLALCGAHSKHIIL